MIRFFRFVLVILVLSVVALFAAITTMHFAIHGAEVAVPDFRGLATAEAIRKAASLDLNLTVDSRFYSADMPAGRVLTQSPASGTVVRREWHVRVTQSLGPQRMSIPNVIGQQERSATIAIRRAGLDLGNVAHMPYPNTVAGTVIAQNPAPDAEGVERPSLSLLIADSSAANTDGVLMPDLTGQTYSAASAAITRAGLRLAPAFEIPANVPPVPPTGSGQSPTIPVPAGIVMSQTPAAGKRVDANTPIQLTITR
jgi:beta-lactam-binding protein with PASTA domain